MASLLPPISISSLPFPLPTSLEAILFSLLAFTVISLALSHLFMPKLHLPPGPVSVPIFGNWLQFGNDLNHENLSQLAKKYGDIFLLRMGRRNLVVVSSPELAKEVLHTKGVEFGSRAGNVVFDIFTGKGQDLVFTIYGDHWRKMRRTMMVASFTKKVVQKSRGHWEQEINYAIEDLKTTPGAATIGVVVRHRLEMIMYNNTYHLLFNRRFEREDDPLFVELRRLNGERGRLAQSFEYNYGDFFPILRPFLRKYLELCQKVNDERLHLFNKYFVEEHKKLVSVKLPSIDEKCAIDHMLDAQKDGEITEDNILYTVENLNAAGIQTTMRIIEWGMAELVNNLDIQSKVRDEMNKILGKGVPITEPDVSKLPYLHAVVKETMRLHMAIPLVPHMNLKQAKLGEYDIPAESKILVNTWYLANNPEWWEKPEVFNPERFLGVEKIDANGNDFRFLPFGVGRRSCPGMILAIPIVSLVFGRFVQSFELLPPPGQTKVERTGKGGQFSLHIAKHSVIVCKPIS